MLTLIRNKKKIIITIMVAIFVVLLLPAIGILFRVIFIFGQYLGSVARVIQEIGLCH